MVARKNMDYWRAVQRKPRKQCVMHAGHLNPRDVEPNEAAGTGSSAAACSSPKSNPMAQSHGILCAPL